MLEEGARREEQQGGCVSEVGSSERSEMGVQTEQGLMGHRRKEF